MGNGQGSGTTEVQAVELSALPLGGLQLLEVAGRRICLARTEDDEVFAIDDTCSHEEESLSEGWLLGACIECPAHNAIFELRTGEPTALPATEAVSTYPVRLEGGAVYVTVPAED